MKKTLFISGIAAITMLSCTTKDGNKPESYNSAEPVKSIAEPANPVERGKTIFTDIGCVACHQTDIEGAGPALSKIAEAYRSDDHGLIYFFKGESEPRVDPEKFSIMQPQLERIKALSPLERAALAQFVLNH